MCDELRFYGLQTTMLSKWTMLCFIRKLSFSKISKVETSARWHFIKRIFIWNELYPESLQLYKLKITLPWQMKIDKFRHFKEISSVKWSFTYRKWLMKCCNDLWQATVNFHNIVIYLSFSTACPIHLLDNSYFKCFINCFIFLFLPSSSQILIMMSQGAIFHFKWLVFTIDSSEI